MTTNTEDVLEDIRREAGLESEDEARAITEATLRTLGARVTDGAAVEVAKRLPDSLAAEIDDPEPADADPFGVEEFLDRISADAGVESNDPEETISAVLSVVGDVVGDEGMNPVRSQLPEEYDALFASDFDREDRA